MTDGPGVFEGRLPRLVRLQLAELVAAHGSGVLADPRRVRAMLSDTMATARREINLIGVALAEGVPERLFAAHGDALRLQTEIVNLTRQLERNNALHPDAAAWAVRSCAWSLGLIPAPEELEPAPIAAPRPLPAGQAERAPTQPEDERQFPPPPWPGTLPFGGDDGAPPLAPGQRPARSAAPWLFVAIGAIVALAIGVSAAATGGHHRQPNQTKAAPATPAASVSTETTPTPPVTESASNSAVSTSASFVESSPSSTSREASSSSGPSAGPDARFNDRQQRVIAALPETASVDWCSPTDANSVLCHVPLAGGTGTVLVSLEDRVLKESAEFHVSAQSLVNHTTTGTWKTPTGELGGLTGQWVDAKSRANFMWTFVADGQYWVGLATWQNKDQSALREWWKAHTILH